MSKMHLKRWWNKRIDFSWSEVARHRYQIYLENELKNEDINKLVAKLHGRHRDIISFRMAKKFGRERKALQKIFKK